ncbi:MAG: DUF541 domain-containing protein [Chloroflexi bacterium]|nr:DUF541 domain-containing protein [Chloroflexota bacterium]
MQKRYWIAIAALILVIGIVVGAAILPQGRLNSAAMAAPTPDSQARLITVSSQGSSSAAPDLATINIGVETQGDNAVTVSLDNAKKMQAVINVVKNVGITDKDIQTSNYNIYIERPSEPRPTIAPQSGAPQTTTTPQTEVIYHVNNTVSVRVRNLKNLGKIMEAVVGAGANNIYGINFSLSDTKTVESQARQAAMQAAQAKAEELARLAGVRLGAVQSVSEVPTTSPVPYAASAKLAVMDSPVQIPGGEVQYQVEVQVTYLMQ